MYDKVDLYGFINAKLKTKLGNCLTKDNYESLIKARSLPEAIQLLKNSDYSSIEATYSKTGDLGAGEAVLAEKELSLFTSLMKQLPEPILSFVKALVLSIEIEKVKNTVRLWFDAHIRGRSIEGRTGYLHKQKIVYDFNVDKVIQSTDIKALSKAFEGTPYEKIALEQLKNIKETLSLFNFEASLENFYYSELFIAAKKLSSSDRKIAEQFIGVDVDIQNITRLIRFKDFYKMPHDEALKHLISGGKTINAIAAAKAYDESFEPDLERKKSFSSESKSVGLELLSKSYHIPEAVINAAGSLADRLLLLENAMSKIKLDNARKFLSKDPFSIGIILAYFTIRQVEIRKIITILNAKKYSLPEERIRSAI